MTTSEARNALLDKARTALRACESELQMLVAEAAQSSLYDDIERLTSYARSLQTMAVETMGGDDGPLSGNRDVLVAGRGRELRTVDGRRRPSRTAYPKFMQADGLLVKVGWSKKKREEYVHRAQRPQVEAIVQALCDMSSNKNLVSSEEILAIHDSAGNEIPTYQTYLTLGWLRSQALIERRGRTGYVVTNAQRLRGPFEDLWGSLTEAGGE